MKTTPSPIQEDMLLLKWPLLWLLVTLLVSALWYGGAYRFREEKNRALQAARSTRIQVVDAVWKIEEDARTLGDYSDRYHLLLQEGVLGEEDRLELVENMDLMRARNSLYPMQLDIQPRASLPLSQESPGDTMTVRASRITLSIPLLHEGDLFHLFEGLNALQRGLIVTEECAVKRIGGDTESQPPLLRENLNASCKLLWLTVNKETGTAVPEAGMIAPEQSDR